jgi:hypothetical protein
VVVKIARDEMVEITSVSSETWNYKKLDGSGVTGLVNPTCLVKVELDTEPPAYPPPPGPERLELERDAVEAKAKVGKGERFWSLPLGTRMRWSNFRPMRRGRPSPTVEAKARTLLETEGKGHDASGRLGEAQRLYFDTEAVQDWSTQVEGDGHTLGGETAIEGGEATEGNEPAVQPAGVRHKDGPLWLGSV